MTPSLRAGTRGSPLALAQADEVVVRLRTIRPGLRTETVVIRTHGDEGYREDLGTALDGKRAFTKRIEDREDPRDALVGRRLMTLDDLGPGVRVGTSSLRRRAQLLSQRPGLEVIALHGNVNTRLRRLDSNDFDAVVVAAAGMRRLHIDDRFAHPLSPDVMTPAPGQGALALEARKGDHPVLDLLSAIDDPSARRTTEAERALGARVGGGCNVPFGALATVEGGMRLRAVLADPEGRRIIRSEDRGDASRWK
ncbi:MAG: hydroxymethylbilane synthase [Methanobacteriota archaeon]|nr:MAG: hydroxymethylbilane synthase [Euryarchaeota archaeon]